MPYVNVKITRDGVTPEHKQRIIAGVTQVLVDVLAKDPALTFVVVDEVAHEDWGVGGTTVDAFWRSRANGAVT